jgi:hypothetical protein
MSYSLFMLLIASSMDAKICVLPRISGGTGNVHVANHQLTESVETQLSANHHG